MIALLALVGWWLLGKALQPVDTMGRQAAAIPGTDLHRRLEVPAAHDELGRLADTFNDLLARIEVAADRQRRFVADAAHELRTPLASLRARLEIDLRHSTAGPDVAASQRMVLGQVTRLADLVNDLLQLARMDADPHLQRRSVDLEDLVWDAVRDAREHAAPRINTTGISPVRVLGDPATLRRVVRNLLDNARRHARHTVTVRLSIDTASPSAAAQPDATQPTATPPSPTTAPASPPPSGTACSNASSVSMTPVPATPAVPASAWPSSPTSSPRITGGSGSRTTNPAPDSTFNCPRCPNPTAM